jgi:hypothetical protein
MSTIYQIQACLPMLIPVQNHALKQPKPRFLAGQKKLNFGVQAPGLWPI